MTDDQFLPTRRMAMAGLAGLVCGPALGGASLAADAATARALKPGQFVWEPHKKKRGRVSIVVSIGDQLLRVHRRGVQIGLATVSTGKAGHETPTGVFTILQKHKDHVSNIYEGAEMPFMQRLTWTGIALHAGNLPGYPASHGCVRMPLEFADLLFGVTRIGTPVVIAAAFSQPRTVFNPTIVGEFYSGKAIQRLRALERRSDAGEPDDRPVTSVLVSRRDPRVMVLENGVIVAEGKATIARPEEPFPSNVFVLSGAGNDKEGLRWDAIGYATGGDGRVSLPSALTLDRITAPPEVSAAIGARMAPGMLLVITDDPLAPDTRSGDDFTVMTADGEEAK